MINLLLLFLFLKLLKRHIGQGAVGTTAGLSIPVVQVAEHLFCHFPEHENLSVGQPAREQAVRFSQTGADLRVKLEGALCWYQTFQPRIAGDAFPDNDAVFLQKLQNSCRSRTTQTERIFDIALKNRALLTVLEDVIDDPALYAGNAKIQKSRVKTGFYLVRQQIDPCAAVLFHINPPFVKKAD